MIVDLISMQQHFATKVQMMQSLVTGVICDNFANLAKMQLFFYLKIVN